MTTLKGIFYNQSVGKYSSVLHFPQCTFLDTMEQMSEYIWRFLRYTYAVVTHITPVACRIVKID